MPVQIQTFMLRKLIVINVQTTLRYEGIQPNLSLSVAYDAIPH